MLNDLVDVLVDQHDEGESDPDDQARFDNCGCKTGERVLHYAADCFTAGTSVQPPSSQRSISDSLF